MNDQNNIKVLASKIANSITFKIITMTILVLLLLLPAVMIRSLIREREDRKKEVTEEIGAKWGGEQILTGPVISIPYKAYYKDKDGQTGFSIEYAHFLPDSLDITGKLFPEKRYRGIYETILYNARVDLAGSFSAPLIEQLGVRPEDVIWPGALITVGISDMRGIKDELRATFAGDSLTMNPGLKSDDVFPSGVSAGISWPKKSDIYSFKFSLNLNGSQQISFLPLGKITKVEAASDWPDPSFTGAYLPYERNIDKNGFSARWNILDLNRNYPQSWKTNKYSIIDSAFGITLFTPVDIYQKSMRTAKYAIMFIVFTFIAFFFSEIMNRVRVHPIQYLLIGLAIMIFYSLLIAISEHTNFNFAYIVSSISVIGLITGYAKAILKKTKMSIMVGGILAILYGYLFIILQLEDYALLMGSVGLFVVLSLVMYFTRKIDWYDVKFEK